MSQKLYDVIVARECRNTHHKLVMNSLKHLRCKDADSWLDLFVKYFEDYLEGSKAPDTHFKDFKNHVLHVSDNYWGGAVGKTRKWYSETVEHLKEKQWRDAVYSAGVLSHYYMDPIMPLHTGQTEEEGVIHRACEWSINKSFTQLIERLESGAGYPNVAIPQGSDWIEKAVHAGAELGHSHYQTFIDHYNIKVGKKDPPGGLDEKLKEITSQLLGYASVGFAGILDRAIEDASVSPEGKASLWQNAFYQITAPISWVYKSTRNLFDRREVSKIAAEYEETGKVVNALPSDEKQVRSLHAKEILDVTLEELDKKPIRSVGSKYQPPKNQVVVKETKRNKAKKAPVEQSQKEVPDFQEVRGSKTPTKPQPNFRLNPNDPLEDAPSIGPKTAKRFSDIGIETVGEFIEADPEITAVALGTRHLNADTINRFQIQARLACQIPGIAGHDAQILEACGFEQPDEIASTEANQVLSLVDEFAKSAEAKYVMRGKQPDLSEVEKWIHLAGESRSLDAA